MSTHTARTARRRAGGKASAKNRSRVSRLRSRPTQSGSPVSRSLTTAMNLTVLHRKISSTPRDINTTGSTIRVLFSADAYHAAKDIDKMIKPYAW